MKGDIVRSGRKTKNGGMNNMNGGRNTVNWRKITVDGGERNYL